MTAGQRVRLILSLGVLNLVLATIALGIGGVELQQRAAASRRPAIAVDRDRRPRPRRRSRRRAPGTGVRRSPPGGSTSDTATVRELGRRAPTLVDRRPVTSPSIEPSPSRSRASRRRRRPPRRAGVHRHRPSRPPGPPPAPTAAPVARPTVAPTPQADRHAPTPAADHRRATPSADPARHTPAADAQDRRPVHPEAQGRSRPRSRKSEDPVPGARRRGPRQEQGRQAR